jgi:hypothetical protein
LSAYTVGLPRPPLLIFNSLVWIGTNTDGVIIDITKTSDPLTRGVIASFKHETTINVTDGIEAAVRKVLADAGVDPKDGKILSLTIGTTVLVSSVSQRAYSIRRSILSTRSFKRMQGDYQKLLSFGLPRHIH